MNLVRESKLNKVREELVWQSLLKKRWSKKILEDAICLDESREHEVILEAAQELDIVTGYDSWVPEEDLSFGFQLYSSIHYCPSTLAEAAKLSFFFGHLVTNHTLNTVISSTMQTIQPKSGSILQDFSAINKWYSELENRYNFSSLEVTITALSSEEQLKRLSKLGAPFVTRGLPVKGTSLKLINAIDYLCSRDKCHQECSSSTFTS